MALGPSSLSRNRAALAAAVAVLMVWQLVGGVCMAAGDAAAKDKERSPIVVTAKALFADNKKKTAVYKKDVVVKKDDITLYADEVTVRLLPSEGAGKDGERQGADIFKGAGKIDTIEAKGGVKIVQQDKVATSDAAVYYSQSDKIVMTGSPRVWQGQNVLTGSRITYDIKDDTFQVDEAKTVLYQDGKTVPSDGEAGKK
jgi:lipopolysaccharide export system protein LptA